MAAIAELLSKFSTAITGLFLAYAMLERYFPRHLYGHTHRYAYRLISAMNPYVQITFPEFTDERLKRSDAYTAIRDYLSSKSTKLANKLKADTVDASSKSLVLNMAENEEIADDFKGVSVWWSSNIFVAKTQSLSMYPTADEKRYYRLTFHRRHRDMITGSYIDFVLEKGREVGVEKRQRKLYTNNPSRDWHGWKGGKWSHVIFDHPATFDTLAMAKSAKEELVKELISFGKGKDYYKRIGKAWKRGYLLYGPPGTGKSTMVAAIANFMGYDVYDLELTIVKDNTELKKLLIDIMNKSVIVIEDIDCSLDLTGRRRPPRKGKKKGDEEKEMIEEDSDNESARKTDVTLSGLLNMIDGLWSACGGERIFIFTTNYVEKLDPALVRRGRMDKHIEMSYCCFEAFLVLAKNYLQLDSHYLFPTIHDLLLDVKITPADVAEHLMPKSDDEDDPSCLKKLISALEAAKSVNHSESGLSSTPSNR